MSLVSGKARTNPRVVIDAAKRMFPVSPAVHDAHQAEGERRIAFAVKLDDVVVALRELSIVADTHNDGPLRLMIWWFRVRHRKSLRGL